MTALLWIVLAQTDPATLAEEAVKAVGGKEKLLVTFRLREEIAVTNDLAAKGKERVSVLKLPDHWYLGKKNRTEDKEPAIQLAWVWTLQALLDPAVKREALPAKDGLVGLRLSGAIQPPMDVWFGEKDRLLAAIDWRKDRHVFSEWKEFDGLRYASRVVGLKADGKPWYHTRVVELSRLDGLPPDLLKK